MNLKFPGGEEMKGDVDFLGFIEDFLGWSNLYEKYRSENWNYFKKELEDLFPSNMVLAIEEVLEYLKTQEEAKTLMLTSFDGTFNTNKYTFSLTDLTAGTTYYFYIINTKTGEGARTGIYTFTTASA